MGIIPFNDHKDTGGIQPFYETPDASEVINEVEFRLSPPIAYGTSAIAGDPEFLISYDPTENQAYWQVQIGGVWQEGQPVDGVRRGDGPPSTPTVTDRLYVDMLNGDLYVAWDDSGTKQWLLVTATPQLWQSLSGITSLISQPTAIQIDEATGHVGINRLPTEYDLSAGGETTLYPSATAAPNLRESSAGGSIVSYGELIDAITTVTTQPYLILDLGPVGSVSLAWTIDYRVRRGGATAKQVAGIITLLSLPTPAISQLEAASNGADVIDEVLAGINPADDHVTLVINAKSTLAWEFRVFASTEGMEVAGVPTRWSWTSSATAPAYATVIGDIRNTFWKNLTKGRLEFSRITNGVAQNERRVWDINGLVTVANSWAEINTHFIPTVDGGAALGVEIRQRAGTAAGTASGQLSFNVSVAGVISSVNWESHGGRLPTNIGVGLNAAGEVVILYRDTGPTSGYAIHTEVYGHTVTQKKLWDLATLAADPSAGYTSFVNATIINGFGSVSIAGQLTSPIRTSAPQFVSATTALSATATSVIFSNAANATLTIPSALTVVGQMLYVGIWGAATASKFIAPSAGQIQVTPAGVTAASVTITTAVVYQAASDGNWYIVG